MSFRLLFYRPLVWRANRGPVSLVDYAAAAPCFPESDFQRGPIF